MKEYVVDFNGAKTIRTFHEALQKGLEFPDYYGKNVDAFWDCITTDIQVPCNIKFYGFNVIKELEKEKSIIIEMLNEAIEWYTQFDEEVKYDIID